MTGHFGLHSTDTQESSVVYVGIPKSDWHPLSLPYVRYNAKPAGRRSSLEGPRAKEVLGNGARCLFPTS